MKKKSVIANRWLGIAAGSVMAMSASMAQAAIVEAEGNDTFATANVGGNTTMIGSIGDNTVASLNDVDIWSFDLLAGQAFSSSISYSGIFNPIDANPVLSLFMLQDGLYYGVAATDPFAFGTTIGFTPWATGTYFLTVSSHFNQAEDTFGNFITTAGFTSTEHILGTSFGEFHGNSFTSFSYEVTAAGVVPVPAAVWLFGSGLLALMGVARRRSHKV